MKQKNKTWIMSVVTIVVGVIVFFEVKPLYDKARAVVVNTLKGV
jgi:uncharacterized membrane-anchored protein YhcB (DUF1043 family)